MVLELGRFTSSTSTPATREEPPHVGLTQETALKPEEYLVSKKLEHKEAEFVMGHF